MDNLVKKIFMDIKIDSKINYHCVMHNIKNDFKCYSLTDSFDKIIQSFTKTHANLLKMNQTTNDQLEKAISQEYEGKDAPPNKGLGGKRRNNDLDS